MEQFPRVGVGAFVLDVTRSKVLLQLRLKEPEKNYWSMPGGRVEFGETLRTAVQREVLEETGVEVTIGDMLCVTDHIGESYHWVSAAFVVYLQDSDHEAVYNSAPDETSELRWFDVTAMPENLTATTINALDHYLKTLTGAELPI